VKRAAPLASSLLLQSILLAACGPPRADATVHVPGVQTTPSVTDVVPSGEPSVTAPAPAAPIAWESSHAAARERAKTRAAPLLVFVFAEWATAAVRMDRTTWVDPRVVQHARSFVALRLDVSKADANAQVEADAYDVVTMPSTVLLDELGHEITRVEGYAGPDDMLAVMRRVVPGH
jgi:thiol:disulfide interchange protein